jgi:hypothetical protein
VAAPKQNLTQKVQKIGITIMEKINRSVIDAMADLSSHPNAEQERNIEKNRKHIIENMIVIDLGS